MAHLAFDPRKVIRTAIKNADAMVNGEIEECISIVDVMGDPLHIPMFVGEEAAVECPPYPYIEIALLSIPAIPHNIGASVREHTCLVSFDVKFTDGDKINVADFGKKVADAIVHQTRTYQCATPSVAFMNVDNQGRIHIEYDCENVILHWIMELSAIFHDTC